jgi:hypothetical protein
MGSFPEPRRARSGSGWTGTRRSDRWPQIQRRIRAETPRQPSPAARGLLGWIREHLLVSGGLATATAVLAAVLILPQMKGPAPDPHFAAIMESPAEGVHGIYFRSEAEGATLVWLSSMP